MPARLPIDRRPASHPASHPTSFGAFPPPAIRSKAPPTRTGAGRASGTSAPAARQDRERRNRRRRLRSLSPLPRRRRADAEARGRCLPLFGGVAAGAAGGTRRHKRSRPCFLRPADRCADCRWHRAMALPLSLGPAAGACRTTAAGPTAIARNGSRITQSLIARRYRRPGEALRDLQRAERLHPVRLQPRRPGAGHRRSRDRCSVPFIT